MSFEDVMAAVIRWTTATEALAALGAELSLAQTGESAPPEIAGALRAVSTAAGLPEVSDLDPQQRAVALGVIRLYVHQALDMLGEPGRAPGWTFTDPVILDGWGRGSTMVPAVIANAHPDLGAVTSFLDVGTGVGLLTVAAANLWPAAEIVGIDPWTPSLERARTTSCGPSSHRITLRQQDAVEIDDVDTYDCIWVPTFFLSESALEQALPALFGALRPGGWFAWTFPARTRPAGRSNRDAPDDPGWRLRSRGQACRRAARTDGLRVRAGRAAERPGSARTHHRPATDRLIVSAGRGPPARRPGTRSRWASCMARPPPPPSLG